MAQSADGQDKIAGVDRSHGSSRWQKLAFAGIHAFSLGTCAWLLLAGGLETVGNWFGATWTVAVAERAYLVLGATALYFARHALGLTYLLVRKVVWSEALSLGVTMLAMEVGFCVLAAGVATSEPPPLGLLDGSGVALVVVGSYLNSWSELQRKWWKRDPAHKGHCYTGGLFRHAMHINYFGDVVLFAGWSMLTATWWTLALPLAMASFALYHIPGLDRYLLERYGDEFRDYSRRTKKLVPFVY